jgi:lipopolysaccharide/colanic/teichoic acid biosynthesis glycosyltransferase
MTPAISSFVESKPASLLPPRDSSTPDVDLIAAGTSIPPNGHPRTIWGFDPVGLHQRFWASYGVQVVRQGEPSEIVKHAELFLLTDPSTLTLFRLAPVMDTLNWVNPQALFVRLHDARERGYREQAVVDNDGRFVRFQRIYDTARSQTRIVLTPDREVAQLWQSSPDPLTAWRRLRRLSKRIERATISIDGKVFDRNDDREVTWFVHDLVQTWKHPDTTVLRAQKVESSHGLNGPTTVWRDAQSKVDRGAKFIGPVWIGAGRTVPAGMTVIGPAVVWDDPQRRPSNDVISWLNIEPREIPAEPDVVDPTPLSKAIKRTFDIVLSLIGILMSLPLYPFIMLAIWLEDGRPWFFGHTRETLGAREFKCWKFRSMRKNADKMKAELKALNQADGPQFFIEKDPRLTKIGRFLRKYNLDELPQFWNVLFGDMSLVGPRPSPRAENQYCPAWREARLSVRPGITGLWQVNRTRRAGTDFQEWIKFDIEYVEQRSFWLDIKIIWKTFANVLFKISRK